MRVRRRALILGLALLVSTASQTMRGSVSLTEETVDGGIVYRLANERVSLLIHPGRGGAVTSYSDKAGGDVELVHQQPRNGFCLDHFQAQPWPGELLDAHYDATVLTQSEDICRLRLTCQVTGLWRGMEYPKLKDLALTKTYTLTADSPALECTVRIAAPTTEPRLLAYWMQSVFFAGGTYDLDRDVSFRPTIRGVRRKAGVDFGHFGPEDFLKDFSDGWIALIDTRVGSGAAVLFDYHGTDILYTCAGNRTLEPMFRTTYLPPGGAVEYTMHVVPVAGLDNVVGASQDFVAGYKMASDGRGSGSVELSLVRAVSAPETVTMEVIVASAADGGAGVAAGQVTFEAPSSIPQTHKLTFAAAGADPLILKVKAISRHPDGRTTEYAFDEYFNGNYKWGENINTDMSSPFYSAPRPVQKINLQKPAKLVLKDRWEWNVWYVEGLLDDIYNITAAIRLTRMYYEGRTIRQRDFVARQGSFGTRLSAFPYDYEELLAYNVIVLGGAKRDALGEVGVEMLCDFLHAGGGMIVLGGPSAYGASGLAGSKLEALWPVTPEDAPFTIGDHGDAAITVAADVPFLAELDWTEAPCVKFLHHIEIKEWGQTVLTADGKPFLVVGTVPGTEARVACLLGAPMGTMGKGRIPFWAWSDWPYLMRQVYWWVSRRDEFLRE